MKGELKVLEETDHPHITKVYELMEDKHNFYVIMELLTGGNLLDRILDMKSFSEVQASNVIK